MAFTGKYICVGVDGTGSKEWINQQGTNSNISKFIRDIDTLGGAKQYYHGPGEELGGEYFGAGSEQTLSNAVNFIYSSLRRLAPYQFGPQLRSMRRRSRAELFAEQIEKMNAIRICIVGHSRGGLIAINIARLLPIPVHFLGLYDAVDRHPTLSGDIIINTNMTYHALRHPIMNSRNSFSNCGTKSRGRYKQQYFLTSHGGIGGDVNTNSRGFRDDITCVSGTLTANISAALGTNRTELCLNNSGAADLFIRNGARLQGIRI